MTAFAQWLDVTMGNRKMKGRELARRIGVHDSAVSKYRTGQAQPSMRIAARIADVFDVDPLRLAKTIGLIDGLDVAPLEIPENTAQREQVRGIINQLPGLTQRSKQALMEHYDTLIDSPGESE